MPHYSAILASTLDWIWYRLHLKPFRWKDMFTKQAKDAGAPDLSRQGVLHLFIAPILSNPFLHSWDRHIVASRFTAPIDWTTPPCCTSENAHFTTVPLRAAEARSIQHIGSHFVWGWCHEDRGDKSCTPVEPMETWRIMVHQCVQCISMHTPRFMVRPTLHQDMPGFHFEARKRPVPGATSLKNRPLHSTPEASEEDCSTGASPQSKHNKHCMWKIKSLNVSCGSQIPTLKHKDCHPSWPCSESFEMLSNAVSKASKQCASD